jgi:membrane protease YdiL (CAAX protease family)
MSRAEALPERRVLRAEVGLVLVLSLLQSGVYAALDLVNDLLQNQSLSQQSATVVGSDSPHPWLDLTYQIVGLGFAVAPVWLVVHLTHRDGETVADLGLDRTQPRRDLARGALLAAVTGGAGLALYLAAHAIDGSLTVVAEDLPAVWWRMPILVLSALHSGVVEETVMVGWLIRRLGPLGWSFPKAVLFSAIVRGSYHLYQGFGAFVGNAIMGVLFAVLARRWGWRILPLVVAHTLIDTVAYVGYAELHGHVSWLP